MWQDKIRTLQYRQIHIFKGARNNWMATQNNQTQAFYKHKQNQHSNTTPTPTIATLSLSLSLSLTFYPPLKRLFRIRNSTPKRKYQIPSLHNISHSLLSLLTSFYLPPSQTITHLSPGIYWSTYIHACVRGGEYKAS